MKKNIFKKKQLKKDAPKRELKKQGLKKKEIRKKEAAKKEKSARKNNDNKNKPRKNIENRTGFETTARTAAQKTRLDGAGINAKEKVRPDRQKRNAGRYIQLSRRGRGFGRGDSLNNKMNMNSGPAPTVRIIPLGGLEQIGMNITAFEYGDSIVVVDCGLAFPEDDMFGIDLVIPDTTYLEENIDKVKGFVITHGHEDHIGALPYVLKKINVPVYGTRLTMGIIENKLREHNLLEITERHVVSFGDVVELGDFDVEFIKTNHSIVDAAALAIKSPAGTIVHTGDFKVDYTPVYGDAIDLQRFAELGNEGVLALMCDSTNSERPGHTPSEKAVGRNIDQIFRDHADTRIIIATFASNVDRVQQIINHAYKYGRKVVVEGRSMVNIIETATNLDVLNVPENTLIDIDQLKNYPGEKTVIITTGS